MLRLLALLTARLMMVGIMCIATVSFVASAADKVPSAASLSGQASAALKAPSFSLKTEDGKTISLADYQGKPLLLHFWATWCPYCKKLQPGLDQLYQQYHPQGLEMLAVSFWEDDGATPQAELDSRGWHFTTVINGDSTAKVYGVKGTPATFFISKTGEIVYQTNNSDPNAPDLEKAIKAILQ